MHHVTARVNIASRSLIASGGERRDRDAVTRARSAIALIETMMRSAGSARARSESTYAQTAS
jgi:hypothetical protein